MEEKKFIVRPKNDGTIFGLGPGIFKVDMTDESLREDNREGVRLSISDYEGFEFNKDSRFEVTIKQIK